MSSPNILPPTCAATSIGSANTVFQALISTLLTAQCSISPNEFWPQSHQADALSNNLPTYDFIIAGGGASGATVAARLSEITDWNILLLEAGENPPVESVIPNMFLSLIKSPVDWTFYAKSKNACKSSPTGQCYMPRGKMLGGSSSMNFMIDARGNIADYNEWGSLGCPGWSFDDVLPYFRKMETNENPEIASRDNGMWHGTSGPLKTSLGDFSGMPEVLEQAMRDANVAIIPDINANYSLGFARTQSFNFDGRRSSSAEGYLALNKDRPNLHVITGAYVEKILFNGTNKAVGVEFKLQNKTLKAYTSKEVIVSAGTIQSPPILLRSGIAPKEDLEEMNITPVANLAGVGKNFTDHVFGHFFFRFDINAAPLPDTFPLDAMYQYLVHKTGPYATVPYITGFYDTTGGQLPDLQLFYSNFPKNAPEALVLGFNQFTDLDILNDFFLDANQQHDVQVLTIALLKAESRGEIKLAQNSTQQGNNGENIEITGNHLDAPNDIQRLVAGLKYYLKLIETAPFKKLGAKFLPADIPECNKLQPKTDAWYECFVMHQSTSGSHQSSTNRMGSDVNAVVDPRCKVNQVEGVRVIDASVAPVSVRANTNAMSLMVGEKGADLIKEDYDRL